MFDIEPVTSIAPTDCGATCMKMLLSYYGKEAELEQLVKECHTSFLGCNGRHLKECAALHELDLKGWASIREDEDKNKPLEAEGDLNAILTIDRPAIVWWTYNHFCVFCGLDDDGKVVVINPDRGKFRLSKSSFGMFYSNVAFTVGMAENLPKGGETND